MGEMVYVLMSLESSGKVKEWRPVGVVTNPDVANQWYSYGKNVDWVPLELDDIQNITPDKLPTFHPRDTTPGEQKAIELSQKMEQTIQQMQEIIDEQTKMIRNLQKGQRRQSSFKSPLLKEGGDESNIPPKPQDGAHPFPEELDDQGIADYIETYATYEVDNQQLYEMFQGGHAVLQLVPIVDLQEGGRDANQQSKANEAKYLKQSIKTQPPAVVQNGKVLDGNHRLRANKRRGLTHMWCYVVM